ncbi:unnamed protein product [Cunninghamella blakesleeana]
MTEQQQIIKEEINSPSIYFENECFEDEDDYCTYCIESDHSSHQHQHQQPVQKDFMPTFYNPFETKHRRRTSRAQFKILETSFYENAKPNATMRRWLAHKLGMTPRSVQVWFQNRRAKAKSQLKKHVNAAAAQVAAQSNSSPSLSSLSSSSPHLFMVQQQQLSSIPDQHQQHSSSFYSPMMNMESPIDHHYKMDYPPHPPHIITPNMSMNDDDYYTLTPPMLSASPSCSSLSPSTMYDHHHQQWQYHPNSTSSSPNLHLIDDPLSVMSYYNHPYPSPADLSSPITDIIYTPTNMNHPLPSNNNNILRRTSFPMESSSSNALLDKDALRRLSEPIFNLQSSSPDYLLMDQSLSTSNIIVDDNDICFIAGTALYFFFTYLLSL